MAENDGSETQTRAGSPSNSSEDFARQEKRAAEGLVDDAKAAATQAGDQAKKLASEKADDLQGAAANHLKSFAEAVRAAGDDLADKEPGMVSDLVRQAAEGLEGFSGALGRQSSTEMIDSVRDFGRQNPVGFLAGSMLAGFALARFASSGSTQPKAAPVRSGTPERGVDPSTATAASSAPAPGERQDTMTPASIEPTYDPQSTSLDAELDPSGEKWPPRDNSVQSTRGTEV